MGSVTSTGSPTWSPKNPGGVTPTIVTHWAPTGKIKAAIDKAFGSFADFKKKFSETSVAQFGSGWGWLVKTGDGLAIETTSNAETPFAAGKTCILTVDVWEHAYYIDYRNARPKYIEEFWKLVNWDFANKNFG